MRDSRVIERYVVSRTTSDRWPVHFRADCERTLPSSFYPDGEGLLEMRCRLDRHGYDLLDELPEWAKNPPHQRPGS